MFSVWYAYPRRKQRDKVNDKNSAISVSYSWLEAPPYDCCTILKSTAEPKTYADTLIYGPMFALVRIIDTKRRMGCASTVTALKEVHDNLSTFRLKESLHL